LDEAAGDWRPSAALDAFLRSGPPPVYVGFGSMVGKNPRELAGLAVAALKQAGLRGVLATGVGGLEPAELPPEVLALDAAPHDWLFPRMAAVVHHGGAGTTAAGLRAGRPSVICPFFGDQGYWGQRVYELGAGPRPVPQKALTVERLAGALQAAVNDKQMRERAAALGRQIESEDGVARAVEIIEHGLAMQEHAHVTHSS
jgi:sterol 3beta-glucosyltransferase